MRTATERQAMRRRARRGTSRGDRLLAVVLLALMATAIAALSSLELGRSLDSQAGTAVAEAPPPSIRAHDPERHVVFRRTLRTLTIKVGRDAPATVIRQARLGAQLSCVHLRPSGVSLYERRVRFARNRRFASVTLPAEVAAALRVCSLTRRGQFLARAKFPRPGR